LQLVDISFIESDEFPKLDIKIRNTGEKVAFLKQANFKVRKIWRLRPLILPNAVKVSWNYNVMLPISGTPYSISKSISQSIEPNAVDRFTFTLGNDAQTGLEEYVFLMTVELIYDEDDKSLTSPNLLFAARGACEILSAYSPGGDFAKNITIQNKRLVTEINRIDGIKSKRLKELIRVISEISIEDK
jgi:hypothetical protein